MQTQDVEIMSSMQHITIQSPPPLTAEQAPSEVEEISPLNEALMIDIQILTYDEIQKKIIHARKKHFPDDLVHPSFIKEKMIVMDSSKNLQAIFAANSAFVGASKPIQSI